MAGVAIGASVLRDLALAVAGLALAALPVGLRSPAPAAAPVHVAESTACECVCRVEPAGPHAALSLGGLAVVFSLGLVLFLAGAGAGHCCRRESPRAAGSPSRPRGQLLLAA